MRWDAAVVGGGPAGAAAGIRLARGGARVVLLERAPVFAPRVCGEFLSGEALAALAALGVPAEGLGAAPIRRVRLTAGRRAAEAALPFPAAGLRRARLDPALLARAAAEGVEVRRGASVREVAQAKCGGFRLALGGGDVIEAGAVVLATGKHDLGPSRRETRWPGREGMMGLRVHLRLAPLAAARLGDAVELHLFEGGCAGLQPVDGSANLCITLRRSAFAAAGRSLDGLAARIGAENRAFAAAMAGARAVEAKPAAIARVPYGFLRPAGAAGALWRVGDQMAVTASLTGDGISLALESGVAAAEALLAGSTPAAYAGAFGGRARRQIRPAMALQALVDRPGLHGPAVAAAATLPGAMRLVARATRLPAPGAGNPWRALPVSR